MQGMAPVVLPDRDISSTRVRCCQQQTRSSRGPACAGSPRTLTARSVSPPGGRRANPRSLVGQEVPRGPRHRVPTLHPATCTIKGRKHIGQREKETHSPSFSIRWHSCPTITVENNNPEPKCATGKSRNTFSSWGKK